MTERSEQYPAETRRAIASVREMLHQVCEESETHECRQKFACALKKLVILTPDDPDGMNCFLDFCWEYGVPASKLMEEFSDR